MTLSPHDSPRLGRLMACVLEVMSDGAFRTLAEIVSACAARGVRTGEASVSARLREARNDHGREVESRNEGNGLWRYSIRPLVKPGTQLTLLGEAS